MSEIDDLDAFVAAGTRLIGVVIQPEWRDAIRVHLSISLEHARIVANFPLPDETDPAAVFSA
jgi:hypothetical protein